MQISKEQKAHFLLVLGAKIKFIRTAKGLTQRNVAFLSGMEPGPLSKIENGKSNTTIIQIKNICFVIGPPICSVFDF